MRRCLELAELGLGSTYTNPLVGCVIVHQGKIIGEGWHQKAGQAHAEVRAIQSVRQSELLAESTVYVSLEPCAHYGKTPPCADLLIHQQVKRVVIGCRDSFDQVDGKGIQKLRNAGIEVTVGVLENEARRLNRRFFTFHEKKRPYIILKWAQSHDGFIAPVRRSNNAPFWMTSPASKQLVHRWRTQEHGIVIGGETLRADNPSLTAREYIGNSPIRIVWTSTEKPDTNWQVCSPEAPTHFIAANTVAELTEKLYVLGIQSVIIEGGTRVLQQFIDAEVWDEARVFTTPVHLRQGRTAPQLQADCIRTEFIQDDILHFYAPRHL